MKNVYRVAVVVWVFSGLAVRFYVNRELAASAVENRPGIHASQPEKSSDVALQAREARWKAQRTSNSAYGAWALVGFMLAFPAVRAVFRHADGGADIEKFLATGSC